MISACGWTPGEVDGADWHVVVALFDYWRDHPPTHELAAAWMGVKPRPPTVEEVKNLKPPPGCLSISELEALAKSDDPSGIGSLIAQFPNGQVPAQR